MTRIVLVSIIIPIIIVSCESCSVSEMAAMQETYNTCSLAGLEVTEPCLMLETVIGECGQIWTRCHEAMEVRRMRDLHLDTILRRREDNSEYEECDVLREFRESGRNISVELTEKCPQHEIAQAQQLFQNCSHETSRSLHNNFHELEDSVMIAESLCEALTVIANECVSYLQVCYRADDLMMTRTSHLDQMTGYLLRMFSGKVNESHLIDCDVNDVNKTYHYDYGSYEDDDATNDQQINVQTTETQAPNAADVRTTRIDAGVGDFVLSAVTERVLESGEGGGGRRGTGAHSGLMESNSERLPESRRKLEEDTTELSGVGRGTGEIQDNETKNIRVTPREVSVNASEHLSRDMEDVTGDIAQELEVNKQKKMENTSNASIIEPEILKRNTRNGARSNNMNTFIISILMSWIMLVMQL